MEYISIQEAADKWNISKRRVRFLCANERIPGTTRIGNMWVIPKNALKPVDARLKAPSTTCKPVNPMRAARKSLKTISYAAYASVCSNKISPHNTKKIVMALFTAELLENLLESPSDNLETEVMELFEVTTELPSSDMLNVRELFRSFLDKHPFYYDDALSWAYQYMNKLSKDSGLEDTQFFTEKYMISALIDRCHLEKTTGKILDPACGGGNFLLYALDYLTNSLKPFSESTSTDYIYTQLERLFGYDLDSTLALIASINLRLKILSIKKDFGKGITIEEFFSCTPNIYCSVESSIAGALDVDPSSHLVRKVGTDHVTTLEHVLNSTEQIFTNPPFQTVKGMDERLKTFLKENFPNSKCDMCNAFIELSLRILIDNGTCGMVTQNSWMYLDSFKQLRLSLLKQYSMRYIIELGSNAFYDLSGEKANVALAIIQNIRPSKETSIEFYSLKNLSLNKKEHVLSSKSGMHNFLDFLKQCDLLNLQNASFSNLSTDRLQYIHNNYPNYGKYAVPMQGTSTGNSKNLVSYFWEHIGDDDWCPVSKGGGYSRWIGLNSYSVKWGKDGEFIKEQKGSAIRNAKYFDMTQLVFSDTGTAGLNVRILRDGQIFIASGPGIRVTEGNYWSHMAFLNSRFSSFFIRLLSPKLTIAAGYIAKIPALDKILTSKTLAKHARTCTELKRIRLSKRPIDFEYTPLNTVENTTTLDEQVRLWFLEDMESELLQLCAEKEIDDYILDSFMLTSIDREHITDKVGPHALEFSDSRTLPVDELDIAISELLSANCMLNRTRPYKINLGCDGILEYLGHKYRISPEKLFRTIAKNTNDFRKSLAKYKNSYIHNLILSTIGYSAHTLPRTIHRKELLKEFLFRFPGLEDALDTMSNWIIKDLTAFHAMAFLDKPLISYSIKNDTVELLGK
jgi:type I restriction-modification system DNA methylase subunit